MIRRPSPRAGQRAAPPPGDWRRNATAVAIARTGPVVSSLIWSRLGSDPDANQLGGKTIAPCGSG